jgi:hypothetical protein
MNSVLTAGAKPAPPSVARVPLKSVVHSDNNAVTTRRRAGVPARVASWFHAQAIEIVEVLAGGTFFTNAEVTRVFCLAGSAGIAPCTDLSTDRVDKDETRFVS